MPMPRLRLGYTKSRNGCLRCKQRRVKVCTYYISNVSCILTPTSRQDTDMTPASPFIV